MHGAGLVRQSTVLVVAGVAATEVKAVEVVLTAPRRAVVERHVAAVVGVEVLSEGEPAWSRCAG